MIQKSETDWYGKYMAEREEIEALRAEVASLKEERDEHEQVAIKACNQAASLTQQLANTVEEAKTARVEAECLASSCKAVTEHLAAANGRVEMMREALEPFALASIEGVVTADTGHVSIRTCAEYFHRAAAALSALPEADRVVRDAERYRLLREYEIDSYIANGSHDKLDSEVDAAISAQEPKQ